MTMKFFVSLGLVLHLLPQFGFAASPTGRKASAFDEEFTDRHLDRLLAQSKKTKQKGMIYVWSPHMPLSIRGVTEAKVVAEKKSLHFIVLLDPYANMDIAKRAAKKEHFPDKYLTRLESRTLLEKDMTLHYPSMIPYQNGQLAVDMRGGYDDPKRLAEYLEHEFERWRLPASIADRHPFPMGNLPFPKIARTPAAEGSKKQPQEEVCRFAPFGVLQRTAPRRATSYFFRTFPDSNFVSYAGVDDQEHESHSKNHNYILDLKTRKEYQLPGPYDPVPICESIMSVPNGSDMRFFDIRKVLAGASNEALLGTEDLGGVYQSVSACPPNGQGVVTMITDLAAASLQRFQIDLSGSTPKYQPAGPIQRICTNVDIKFPMLSKDGKEISGRDQKANSTKVWRIEADGQCTPVLDFHFLAGKTDFSFDGNQLVFHVRSDVDDGNYFRRPSQAQAMNIYLYDRVRKTIKKITNNFDRNSYYPVFKRDGTIVYMDATRDGGMSFIWVDPRKSPEIPFDMEDSEHPQAEASREFQALVALGRTWYELCADLPGTTTVDSSALTALSLDQDECQDMVKKYWPVYKTDVVRKTPLDKSYLANRVNPETLKQMKLEDILAVCPKDDNKLKEVEVLGDLDDTLVQDSHSIIEAKCMSCHNNMPFNDPDHLAGDAELVKKMLWRISEAPSEKRMPMGGALSLRESTTLRNYLQAILDARILQMSQKKGLSQQGKVVRVRRHRPKDLPPLIN